MIPADRATAILRKLLTPIVRVALTRLDCSVQQFIEVTKHCFLDIAEQEMVKQEKKINVSRLSVVTGLNRPDIVRIRKLGIQKYEDGGGLLKRVVHQWQHNPNFCTKAGVPRVLSCRGEGNDLEQLVHTISKDTGYQAVLFELLRKEYVTESNRGISLIKETRGHLGDPAVGLDILQLDMDSLSRAVEGNLFEDADIKNHHIRTEYDAIAPSALPKLQKWILEAGQNFHRKVRAEVSKYDKDISKKYSEEEGSCTVVVTSFGIGVKNNDL